MLTKNKEGIEMKRNKSFLLISIFGVANVKADKA
jgi:hypothetical protein